MFAFFRLAIAPRRLAACGLVAFGAIVAAAPAVAGASPILSVTIDQAKIARVPEGTKTLVIGSPIVADVTLLHGSNTMVVTGKGYGETNLIALDDKGNILDEKTVRVEPTGTVLIVQRGMEHESYSCAPRCMPVVELGDGDEFGRASGQITQRNSLATPTAAPAQGH